MSLNKKRAQQLFEKSQYKRAITYLHKYLAEEPKPSDSTIYMLAWSYVKTQEYEKAIEYAKTLVVSRMDLFKGVGHHIFAIYHSYNSNRDEALNSINEALNINPNSGGFLSEKAQIHINRGEEKIALGIIENLLQKNPNDVAALKLKNEIYGSKKSKFNEAKGLMKEILRLEPDKADSFKESAATMLQNGFYDQAYELYNKSLRIDPTDTEVILNMKIAQMHISSSVFKTLNKVQNFFLKKSSKFLILSIMLCFWITAKSNYVPILIMIPLIFTILCLVSFNLFSKKIVNLILLFKRETRKILFKKNKTVAITVFVLSIIALVLPVIYIFSGVHLYAKLALLSYTFLFQAFLFEYDHINKQTKIFLIISNLIAISFYLATNSTSYWGYSLFFYMFFVTYMFSYFTYIGLKNNEEE